MNAQAEAAIEKLAQDPMVIGVVKDIEAMPKTTQNHYGAYMSVLGGFGPGIRGALALALIKAGGNEAGIDSAMRILGGA